MHSPEGRKSGRRAARLRRWLTGALVAAALGVAAPATAYEWPGKLADATADLSHPDPTRRAAAIRGLVYFSFDTVREPLLLALDDPSPIVRLSVMEALVELGAHEVTARLHPFLNDPDPIIRIGAANSLGELGDRRDLDVMVRVLGDPDVRVRTATIRALGRLGLPEARTPVATMLGDSDLQVVITAIEVLSRIGDSAATFPLLEKVKDPSIRVQVAAIQALGRLRDPRAVLPLVALLHDLAPEVQAATIDALGRLGDPRATGPLTKLLWVHHNNPTGSRIIYALGDIGDPTATDALLQVMRYSTSETASGMAATDALKKIGPGAIAPTLLALTQNQDASFQRRCLEVLQHVQLDARTRPADRADVARSLVPELGRDRLPRPELLAALLMGRTPEAALPLMELLIGLVRRGEPNDATRDRTSAEQRQQLLGGLARFDDARLVKPTLELYPKLTPDEQRMALGILGQAPDAQAIEVLGQALEKGDWETQRAAARALGRVDRPQAGRLLLRHMRADQGHLLSDLAVGLGANTDPGVSNSLLELALKTSGEVRFSALQALGDHLRRAPLPRAQEALLELVADDPDERVAARAADALAPRRPDGGVKALARRYREASTSLRLKLVQVLGDWGDPAAAQVLGQALEDPHAPLRAEAAWALGRVRAPGATELLIGLLADERWPVSLNAAAALRLLADPASKEALQRNLPVADAYTQVNVLLALHALDAAPERRRLIAMAHREANPRLIEAVAFILASRAQDEDRRALEGLLRQSDDPAALTLIERLLTGQELPDGPGWVRYILNDAGRRMIGQRVILIFPDGTLLGRTSDSAGEIRAEGLTRGSARITFLDDVFTPY